MIHRRTARFVVGALIAFTLADCSASAPTSERPAGQPLTIEQPHGVKATMGAPSEVHEELSAGLKCKIDAAKVCLTYAATGPSDSDSRTITIAAPSGPTIAVRCGYAGHGGTLISAVPPTESALDGDSAAFMAAHNFCIGRHSGP